MEPFAGACRIRIAVAGDKGVMHPQMSRDVMAEEQRGEDRGAKVAKLALRGMDQLMPGGIRNLTEKQADAEPESDSGGWAAPTIGQGMKAQPEQQEMRRSQNNAKPVAMRQHGGIVAWQGRKSGQPVKGKDDKSHGGEPEPDPDPTRYAAETKQDRRCQAGHRVTDH